MEALHDIQDSVKTPVDQKIGAEATEQNLRKIKIGIDVGGTFTHAVAIDVANYEVIGKSCVPTTHDAQEGVAKGVVESMNTLIENSDISPNEVTLIAHSTTQATNALLEGDVATVGIIGLGQGMEGSIGKSQMNLQDIELAPGKFLPTKFRYLNTDQEVTEERISALIKELAAEGAEVFVASEVFGVDNPKHENEVVQVVEKMGYLGTAASNISRLYGLKTRTRTAVINASMMPKMLETANMTEKSIREAGMEIPLMVMRSDGGIMDVEEMRKRPILTMLSGPAAGVAAALMYAKISDGIFIEVGGTSSDISVIKNGKPQVKSAQVGGKRLYLQTLDVRTVGIGGGSVPRFSEGEGIKEVGPRSAHIAGLHYSAFTEASDFDDIELSKVQPKPGDPSDYLKITKNGSQDTQAYTVTPTSASHLLGMIKEVGHGGANSEAVKSVYESLSKLFKSSPKEVAEKILTLSAKKIEPVIDQMFREYKLDRKLAQFVGGGGGASAVVPFTASYMDIPFSIAKNAEVISAIGAALGMIQDRVEKSVMTPTDQEILEVRQQAVDSVIKMGANPDTVEVHIEVDNKNKKIVATASGSSELRTKDLNVVKLTEQRLKEITAKSMGIESASVETFGSTGALFAMGHIETQKRFGGLFKSSKEHVRIIDEEGTIKLQLSDCKVKSSQAGSVRVAIQELIEDLTSYGDAGGLVPDIYVLLGSKVVDLSGLIEQSQILALLEMETKNVVASEPAVVVAITKH